MTRSARAESRIVTVYNKMSPNLREVRCSKNRLWKWIFVCNVMRFVWSLGAPESSSLFDIQKGNITLVPKPSRLILKASQRYKNPAQVNASEDTTSDYSPLHYYSKFERSLSSRRASRRALRRQPYTVTAEILVTFCAE